MSKLRLDIKSSMVLDTYGIVNIVFNGTTLISSKQLSATVETLEYDVDILTSSDNVLKISLLNDMAIDGDNDGDYNGPEDQTLRAIVSNLSYSLDNVNYTTVLPQSMVNLTVPSGTYVGQTVELRPSISEFVSYGSNDELKFDDQGLGNTAYIQGYNYIEKDGIYYDKDGNVVPE